MDIELHDISKLLELGTVDRVYPAFKTVAQVAREMDDWARRLPDEDHPWFDVPRGILKWIADDLLPSGSGVDCGTKWLDPLDNTLPKRYGTSPVFFFEYHHMNDGGYYDGWTDHYVQVKPDCSLEISGRDRNGIKEYFHDLFGSAFGEHCAVEFKSLDTGLPLGKFYGRRRYWRPESRTPWAFTIERDHRGEPVTPATLTLSSSISVELEKPTKRKKDD